MGNGRLPRAALRAALRSVCDATYARRQRAGKTVRRKHLMTARLYRRVARATRWRPLDVLRALELLATEIDAVFAPEPRHDTNAAL